MLQLWWIWTLVWIYPAISNNFLGRTSVTDQELIKEEEDLDPEATAEEMTTEEIALEETETEDHYMNEEITEGIEETEEDMIEGMIEGTTEGIMTEGKEDTDDY